MKNRINAMIFFTIVFLSGPYLYGFEQWPDTGQTRCYDDRGNEISPCPGPGEAFLGQDAAWSTRSPSYTKLAPGGMELPDSATHATGWIMTQDNVTGLTWEVKTEDGTIHDSGNQYTWCVPANQSNPGICGSDIDTAAFVEALNTAGFGGFSDWRIPTVKELATLVNYSAENPAIDTDFFPETRPAPYWTSTSSIATSDSAWRVNFRDGSDSAHHYTSELSHVRGVRGGRTSVTEPTGNCGAYVAPGVWKAFDCYNLAAIGRTTSDDPFTPSWRLIGGYWQWGRKGPGPGEWYDTNTPNFAHGPTGPDTGDANQEVISGWDQTDAPDGAWSDSRKTVNDPCPEGFRVPTNSQWEGVLNNNNQSIADTWSSSPETPTNYSAARFFGSDLMLPASGYRYYVSGSLYLRGINGYYWSSSEYGSDKYWYLYFYNEDAATGSYENWYGFSIRCVSE